MNRTLIIAEVGVNHNGSLVQAKKLVERACFAGVDIVKFQTFKASSLVTKSAEQADYQLINTGKKESQLSMLKRLELSYADHFELLDYCNKMGVEFLSTAFDSQSLKFLVENLKLSRLKISSGDITDAPLLLEYARTGCDLIVSTGMASMQEVKEMLSVVAYGLISDVEAVPSVGDFNDAFISPRGQRAIQQKVTILHCTTQYPAPIEDINLRAMDSLAKTFNLQVGYSDHSQGITVALAAVARGASVIEKHFTLDCSMQGPDHKASLEPDQLKALVSAIRIVEQALGDGIKIARPSEEKNKKIARKSIVAAKSIAIGDVLTKDNIAIKRPGYGLSPYLYWDLLGQTSLKIYDEGEPLDA